MCRGSHGGDFSLIIGAPARRLNEQTSRRINGFQRRLAPEYTRQSKKVTGRGDLEDVTLFAGWSLRYIYTSDILAASCELTPANFSNQNERVHDRKTSHKYSGDRSESQSIQGAP